MVDDIVLNKIAIIERCLKRIKEEYCGHENELETNFTRQDSIILNLQRCCEVSIDLAMHLVNIKKLGLPQDSRDAFSMLSEAKLIPADLKEKLQSMVGFRNLAVHDYQEIDLKIVRNILDHHLGDFREYTKHLVKLV